jgi:catechol 2,3-dioxygenase-like lactoylglutathione lyase family enzyme
MGLTVRDVDASAAWYEEVLGFRRVGEFTAPDGARRKDLYESIRSAAVNTAVEQFTARVSAAPDLRLQDWHSAPESWPRQ